MMLPRPWEELNRDIIHCTKCGLCRTRMRAVPGQGSLTAEMMLVGEAPGGQEDLQGKAFVGPAGRFLTELLEQNGIVRDDVFITNILKCRPPNNRAPETGEIEQCIPYLRQQVALLQPRLIVTLGGSAFKSLVREDVGISRVHGQFFKKGRYTFFASYHPAAALHHKPLREVMIRDFALLGQKWRMAHGNHHQPPEALDRSHRGSG